MNAIARELKKYLRQAADPDDLIGKLPTLSEFALVRARGEEAAGARTRYIVRTVIPNYALRLPGGPKGQAIRELLTWHDENGEYRTLDVRYRAAAEHLVCGSENFGRRKEPMLLEECARHFIDFDAEDSEQPKIAGPEERDIGEGPATAAQGASSAGVISVYPHLDFYSLELAMRDAREINVLSTFIPAFDVLYHAIQDALRNNADVRILMLHPESPAASMRATGLSMDADEVASGVEHCLSQLARMAQSLDEDERSRLKVKLFDSLPSIAVYSVDDHSLVSVFLHDQLAIHAPQIELHGRESLLAKAVFKEFMTLWDLATEFSDIRSWSSEIGSMLGGRT